ncbi:MAG: hypothetical protein P1U36_03295 [Legionellaceae bacterium]|nr:hypothetical protein [Legionellaceae bacterium]
MLSLFFRNKTDRNSGSDSDSDLDSIKNLDSSEKLVTTDELDTRIAEERNRLIITRARTLSPKYQDLISQRQQLDSSPRGVETLPPSPVKNPTGDVNNHSRSSRNLKLGFLSQAPRSTTPVVPVLVGGGRQHYQKKLAYGLSDVQPSYMQKAMAQHGKVADDSLCASVFGGSSQDSSVVSQSITSSFSDTQFLMSNSLTSI